MVLRGIIKNIFGMIKNCLFFKSLKLKSTYATNHDTEKKMKHERNIQ